MTSSDDTMHPAPADRKADLRDFLAAERTFLAWIRTGLALMGFGFVVARFGLFLQQLQFMQHTTPRESYGLSIWFGTALITLGVVVVLVSAWHHLRLTRELDRGAVVPLRPSRHAVWIALLLAAVGIAMAVYLVVTHAPTALHEGGAASGLLVLPVVARHNIS